ncbi:MAG: DNA polymerase [Candidatus Woesearchaeota archaeon]
MIYVITKQTLILPDRFTVQHDLCFTLNYWENIDVIACDTETSVFRPWNGKLVTIQLGNREDQFVVDCLTIDSVELKPLLESKLLIFHNTKFDWQWLHFYGIDVKNTYDTFLCECILTTGFNIRQLGLADVSKKYTGVEVGKEDRGLINRIGLAERTLDYCVADVKYLHEIREKQLKKIEGYNLQRVLDLENKVVRTIAIMECNGVLLDSKRWLEVADIAEKTVEETIKTLDELVVQKAGFRDTMRKFLNLQTNLFGFEERKTLINWASNDQKKKILREFGYNVTDVADRTLQRFKGKHQIFKELITFSRHQKLATSFGRDFLKFINKTTGRIHPETWQILHGARLALQRPNLLQIPSKGDLGEKIRSCFIAREGNLLVTTDVANFELRILAEFSQDPLWLEIFNSGKDLHSELCARTFNVSIENVNDSFPQKPDLSYRFVQKIISFGIAYGISAHKLSDVIQTDIITAQKIIDDFFKVVPELKKFLAMIAATVVAKGQIRSDPYYKRIRWFPQLRIDDPKSIGDVERAALNFPPQATNSNLIKEILVSLQNEIDENNHPAQILLVVHDEIVTEVPESFAKGWKTIQETIMIETIKTIIKSIPVEVTTQISKHWKK